MARRLGPLERELRDLEEGKVFVNAFRPESFEAYLRWAQSRFTNLGEMTSVAKLVVTDFVTCLSSSPTHPVTPKDVVESVERLATFYRATVAFESNCRTILPIESLTALHQHLYGWSDPIREAVQQVFRYLKQVEELPVDGAELSFTIIFPEPRKAQLFSEELQRMNGRADVLDGW